MSSYLVLAPRHNLDDTAPVRSDDVMVLAPLPTGASTSLLDLGGHAANTALVRWDIETNVPLHVAKEGNCVVGFLPWSRLSVGLLPSAELAAVVFPVLGAGIPSLTPVMLLAGHPKGAHAWVRLRLGHHDALFVRVTEEPISLAVPLECDPAGSLYLVAARVHANHREHSIFLNNHQCYYRHMFNGEELEHKYVLDPKIDIWTVIVDLYTRVRAGEIPGIVPEYGDEFQAWDYLNHVYEVRNPAAEQGYISYIPLSTGGYTIKRKWFAKDSTRRRERHYKESGEVVDRAAYLRSRFGVEPHQMPSFRRVRYDINIESLATGHLYGIYLDHSRLVDAPEVAMVQCELEYIRTRSILNVYEADVLREMEDLAKWLEAYFTKHGIITVRGTYSKLSFLRDAVRAGMPGGTATPVGESR